MVAFIRGREIKIGPVSIGKANEKMDNTISDISINKITEELGITAISSGGGRDVSFKKIVDIATKYILYIGIGMTNLRKYGKKSLAEQAEKVPVDILMLNPEFLEKNLIVANSLEKFFDIGNFAVTVRQSFDIINNFGKEWNSNPNNKIRLRLYDAIPSAS